MPQQTERELLLQNLVATGASLLFRASKALGESATPEQREAVIIETERWFLESKAQIIQALARPEIYPSLPEPVEEEESTPWKKPNLGNLSFFLD